MSTDRARVRRAINHDDTDPAQRRESLEPSDLLSGSGTPIPHVRAVRKVRSSEPVSGDFVSIGRERFYRIANYDRMEPFFMSVVSASNLWMFVSSRGGLTAGRRNPDLALFPYATEDKIHDASDHTGSRTILRVGRDGQQLLWEPFDRGLGMAYELSRNLYKSTCGDSLVFEEINHDLDLTCRVTWMSSDAFGIVKRSEIVNSGSSSVALEVLDGIQNILPFGLNESFQNTLSCLGDAYKQNELEVESGIATYSLSSIPGDGSEPAEALRASTCWSTCDPAALHLVSSYQLDDFRRGRELLAETRIRGRRGAYFVHQPLLLEPKERREWLVVADVDRGPSEVAALRRTLASREDMTDVVLDDVRSGTQRLAGIVAAADGMQLTGDTLGSVHHFSNVLFNVMRGGIFESGYTIDVADLENFVRAFNRNTWRRHRAFLRSLGESCELCELLDRVHVLEDPGLLRLVTEYLPLSFSRRHGDPSRPWNRFSINVKHRDGSKILNYEGNWRDIFQNWEALALSFPEFLTGMITKFVNTSTADGHNPYRISRDGYEWEKPNPHEPWTNFGYWGDHQLIYLLKLLELSREYHPGKLENLLFDDRFVYADVPYDIKPYSKLLEDPRASIVYNRERERRIADRVAAIGFDGRFVTDSTGETCRACLAEKLLVSLMAKVCNLVAGAGFWMNTQRPEWNDANNALPGYGVSVVTLCYARRYVAFCLELFGAIGDGNLSLNAEVAAWLRDVVAALQRQHHVVERDEIGGKHRALLLDDLGRAAQRYREMVYEHGLGGERTAVAVGDVVEFLASTLEFLDQGVRMNRRSDGLYHAYNVLHILPEELGISRLQPMLEGQVAALSSGALTAKEAVSVLEALRNSELYRSDQQSYLLYPDRTLPGFLEKNTIPPSDVDRSALLSTLIEQGNTDVVERDVEDHVHFNGCFQNVRDVRSALSRLDRGEYGRLVEEEAELVCEIYESVFDHTRFTGRSGTFYGYEGLGCIYWHMVSKLLLAVQECCFQAAEKRDGALEELVRRYYEIRAGLGFNKSPAVCGAFPMDAYSHTPAFAGARQPGMTGQVKEEIITRLGELGLVVRGGRVIFWPVLLRPSEFLPDAETFEYVAVDGSPGTIELEPGTLAFTYCQVPVVYRRAEESTVTFFHADGSSVRLSGLALDAVASREIFCRSGRIVRLAVSLTPGLKA